MEGEMSIKTKNRVIPFHCAYDELWPLEKVIPNPRNPNTHSDAQIGLLSKIIDAQGWRAAITVSKRSGFIVRGHARLLAAMALGTSEVPVDLQDYENEAAEWADLISDNRIAELAVVDKPLMNDILEELKLTDLDLDLTGYDSDAVAELMTEFHMPEPWNPDGAEEDGLPELVGYNLSSFWKDLSRVGGQAFQYMLKLPQRDDGWDDTVAYRWSRTNSEATERIVRTYMREGDFFYEMCSGWVTFSATAKYLGFSGKASDIWDKALAFDKKQIDKMPGVGKVEIVEADCRHTGEPDNTYDFVHSNPPFFGLEEYSDSKDDLSGLDSYDKWLLAMVDMAKEAERILKPNGLANFVLNDYREKSYLVNMHSDFLQAVSKNTGLKMWDMVVSEVISQSLRFRKKSYQTRRTVKCHEYIMTFKKG
jgi:predicted RNA methylase